MDNCNFIGKLRYVFYFYQHNISKIGEMAFDFNVLVEFDTNLNTKRLETLTVPHCNDRVRYFAILQHVVELIGKWPTRSERGCLFFI